MAGKLLIIGFVWPEPNSSAAGSRMVQLIETFISANYQITFATACSKSENAVDLSAYGVEVAEITLNDSSFDVFVKKLTPDVVLFDRFMTEEQYGWRVAENCPNAIRILDTEDLHGLRKGRQQAFKDKRDFDKEYLFNDIAKREIASIYRCDLSLIISEAEMKLLINQFNVDKQLICYLPFMLSPILDSDIQSLPKFEERRHFVTIGNFLHEPNYQSVLFLKGTIWPLIKRQLPDAEMHVYGAYANQKVNQLNNEKEGFYIKGFANDVNKVLQQARLCLAPLQFGAGLKGKLVDAMINGTPCIMTGIAAEGMFGGMPVNGFVEDNSGVFAEKAKALYGNESIWKEKQRNGFEVINQRFDKNRHQDYFLRLLTNLKSNLEQHRLQNFTGSMLHFHTLQASKYMGRWIEEKNKKTT